MFSLFLIAGMVGIMLFFTVAVAPTIFKVLPQEWAGTYVRHFFPKYYLVLFLVCLIASLFANQLSIRLVALNCAGLFAISLWQLTPAINKAKDQNKIKIFNSLHRASVVINVLALLLLIGCFFV